MTHVMKMSRWWLPAGLVPVVILLLSFSTIGTTCIAIATATPTPAIISPTEPSLAMMPTPATPTPTPEPQRLVFGLPAMPDRLDPAVTTDRLSALISTQIYDTLVRFAPGTTTIEPALATDWSVSDDGLTWEFVLREGVTFHDGTPLTAQAVVWNFQRWMDTGHPAHKGDFLFWNGMFGSANNNGPPNESSTGLVVAVDAPDGRTVRLTLNQPFAPLLHNLALTAFAIVSPQAVMLPGVDEYATQGGARPIGTGPFQVTEWKDDEIRLDAYQDYWGGSPALNPLVFRSIPDDHARFEALLSNDIHGMLSPTEADLQTAKETPELQVILDSQPTTAFLNFNHDNKYLSQPEVRQAIAYAIDKQALIETAFGPTWQISSQMLPPAIWGYNETIESYPYDPDRSRELIAEAGLVGEIKLELWYPDRPRPYLPYPKRTAETIASDLEAVGMAVTLQTEDWAAYLADRSNGTFATWLLGWTGYNGDPDGFYFYHFGLPTPREGNYVNEELRSILLQGQVIVMPNIREKLYKEAATIIHEDVPRIFLAHPREAILLSLNVTGFRPNPAGPETFFGVRRTAE